MYFRYFMVSVGAELSAIEYKSCFTNYDNVCPEDSFVYLLIECRAARVSQILNDNLNNTRCVSFSSELSYITKTVAISFIRSWF